MGEFMFIFLLVWVMVPVVKSAIPGTFFWKPRMAIDLSIPTTPSGTGRRAGALPTKENIREGLVVLVDGYEIGLNVIAFAVGVSDSATYPYLNPFRSHWYTDVYRWILRYVSLLPGWLKGSGRNVVDTTKLWRRRFYNLDALTPKWVRHMIWYVPKKQWEQEDHEMKMFKKHALGAYGKHLRLPNRHFDNFRSFETEETLESESAMSSGE